MTAYLVIENFNLGLDRRRHILALPPGSLYELKNGHISRGGEVEKRKAFVAKYVLPAGSFGMQAVGNSLYVFGSGADPGVPAGVTYQRLQHPDALAMSSFVDSVLFNNLPYVLAKFSDNTVEHFYNGSLNHDWIDGVVRAGMVNNNGIAAHLASIIDADPDYAAAAVGAVVTITGPAGIAFTTIATAANGGAVDNQTAAVAVTVSAVPGISGVSSGTSISIFDGNVADTISSITVDGVEILNVAQAWATTGTALALLVANQINTFVSVPEYTAVASGNKVTILAAAAAGAGPNGFSVTMTKSASIDADVNGLFTGGVNSVAAVAQQTTVTVGGTFEVGDKFTVQLIAGSVVRTFGAGRPNGSAATAIRTLKDKVYAGASTNLLGSGVKVPTGWNSEDIGAFITDMSGQVDQFDSILGLGTFLNNLAILARRATQIWSVDPDPSLNAQLQVMPNIGTVAGRSVISYADSDLFFLADTGVRSLRSHQFFNIATKSDIGTPIDPLVIAAMNALGATTTSQAVAAIDPADGRYWLALGGIIYVFSYFPDSKISAWSTYDDGRTYTDFAVIGNRIYARSGNTIYLYGGDNNATYDTSTMQIRLPFLSAKMLATVKHFLGIDLTTEGEFSVYIASDPNKPDNDEIVCTLSGSTFGVGIVPVDAESEMFSLRLTHSKAEYAKLVHAVIHYEPVAAG
jgi:hypothetical protein